MASRATSIVLLASGEEADLSLCCSQSPHDACALEAAIVNSIQHIEAAKTADAKRWTTNVTP
jgi:hypothetical protein